MVLWFDLVLTCLPLTFLTSVLAFLAGDDPPLLYKAEGLGFTVDASPDQAELRRHVSSKGAESSSKANLYAYRWPLSSKILGVRPTHTALLRREAQGKSEMAHHARAIECGTTQCSRTTDFLSVFSPTGKTSRSHKSCRACNTIPVLQYFPTALTWSPLPGLTASEGSVRAVNICLSVRLTALAKSQLFY